MTAHDSEIIPVFYFYVKLVMMKKLIVLSVVTLLCVAGLSQTGTPSKDSFYNNFVKPPDAALPRVWWHWMNGNITKDGIRKDLEWMHRSGIGGFQNFDAALLTPQIVEKRLVYMTPEWKDAFHFAAQLADSLKLEMAIAGSPGWSQSGGPWVPAKNGMKKLVWREIRVTGGQAFNGPLPMPYTTTGTFQNIPLSGGFASKLGGETAAPEYHKDVAVLGYRLPAADVLISEMNPKISSSGGNFTLTQLTDDDLVTTSLLPSDSAKGHAWIQYEFPQPQTIKSLTLVGGGTRSEWGAVPPANDRSLEVSDDGMNFRRVAFLPAGGVAQQTIAIPEITARYFRITFQNPVLSQMAAMAASFGMAVKPPAGTDIAEIVLHPVTRINHAEEKAGFAATYDLEKYPTPSSGDAVAEADVIDLTAKMNADGTLNWTPPAGKWKIIRFGYSLTGKKNHPASPEATGLEVDKLDAQALKDYFENYLNQYKDATGGLMGSKGLQYLVTDSYEAEQETWTPKMAEEFQKRRGYSLLPWMPVLTGQIVKNTAASEQFLWDWRKTFSELIAENYYDQLTNILATYGMKRYSESHENGRLYLVDGMDVKRTAAVPMSAMWVYTGTGGSTYEMAQADIRESASVAHIYGQNLVAAESLTASGMEGNAWSYSPESLKPTADLELASGLNRFVIHTSAHQPVDDKIPGVGLFIFGQWFNRHETWANQAKAWTDYLARSSYMLQQGKFVADVVYYYGEDNNITGLFGSKLPDIPEGYGYDFINPHALINLLSVRDGKLVTPSGMSYRVLVLDSNSRKMSLPVLRKIAQLVKAGATISGVKPAEAASLTDNQQEFDRLVNEIWGSGNTKVITGKPLSEVLPALNIAPDFIYSKPQIDTKLLYVHRNLADEDIYWINNRNNRTEDLEATFRIAGKVPELWHPETGQTETLSYSIANGITKVKLHLVPNDAVFVLFREKATQTAVALPLVREKQVAAINGAWTVSFQKGRGAPESATFEQLGSYTENADAGIKYFSGTATYTKTITADKSWFANNAQLWLDLGKVKNLAEIIVNGQSLGIVWKQPFRVNVTGALKAGDNKVEIKVTNLWVNRLIGDTQPGVTNKITYTTMPFYKADSPLLPSGLLGPVQVIAATK